MSRFSLLIIFFIGIPYVVFADVQVTEIAWMGTAESQFSEWVEFYNDTDQDVNMSGWKLYEAGGDTVVFTFSKTIPTKGYILLERTTPSAPDPVVGINDESGSFGGSGLANSGEFLVLKDESGTTRQSLDFSGGWPAGESDTKKTMQWNGSSWVTDVATPKSSNIKIADTPKTEISLSGTTTYVPPKTEPRVELVTPKNVYADVSYEYEARTYLESGQVYNGSFVWNMGDGTIYKSITPKIVTHTYAYPGTYTISFGFYRTSYDKKPLLFETVQKNVTAPTVTLQVDSIRGFSLTNNENLPFDVSDWVIKLPDTTVSLPPLSIIAPKSTVIIPFEHLGLKGPYSSAILLTPEWKEISRLSEKEVVAPAVREKQVQLVNKSNLIASAEDVVFANEIQNKEDEIQKQDKQKSYTKAIFLGIALLIVIGLFLLLERFMAQQE